MLLKAEFIDVGEALIRQIAQAIDGFFWQHYVAEDDVRQFNRMARALFDLENDILDFFSTPRTRTHSTVDPNLPLPGNEDRLVVGFVCLEPGSKQSRTCAISIWEREEPGGTFELVDADDHTQEVAIELIYDWLEFADSLTN